MASSADCLRIIEEAAGGILSDDELEGLLEELQRIQRARIAAGKLEDLERDLFDAAEQIAADVQLAAAIEKRNRLINVVKENELLTLARRADEAMDDPSIGLEAAMVGVNSPFQGGRLSVDALSNALMRKSMGGMLADMKAAGVDLEVKYKSGALDREIARELWDMSLKEPTGTATGSADARAIAEIIHKYRRAAIERENRAGAYIRYRSGYVTRQSHDAARIRRAGADPWKRAVENLLDWDAMEIAPTEREDFLQSAYEVLTTGIRKDGVTATNNDLMFAFKGPGNLAKKESASRVILFRDADAWSDYNARFGSRSLNESIMADLSRAARSTALMERFGTNPRAMFDRVREALEESHRGDGKKVERLKRRMLEYQFSEIDGTVNLPGNDTLASIGRGTRAVQSMAKLGGAVISSITDLASVAAERRYQGRSLLDAWGDALGGTLEGLSARGDKRRAAELIGAGIDGALGDMVSRFAAQDDIPGRMSKTMGYFFKWNLLGPWTDGVKRGVGLAMARDLAIHAESPWESLPESQRRLLGQYGFDARKWEVARLAVKDHDGRAYMLGGEVASVRGAPFTGLTERQQTALRDEVSEAIFAYINDRIDFASPTPGARERAMLRLGLQPGTVAGETVRFLTQFKAFPVTVLTKGVGRELYGHGAKTWRAALLKGEGDMLGISAYIAATTMLGYFALQAKEIAKGREPRDNDWQTFTAAALQGGGLGIFGDFLLGQTNRFGNTLLDTLAGPTLGTIADLDQIRAKIFAGEDAWAQTINVVKANTPFANLFYLKPALDYLIFYHLQEWASPGYLRRMERRARKENGQEYFLPPSAAVREIYG